MKHISLIILVLALTSNIGESVKFSGLLGSQIARRIRTPTIHVGTTRAPVPHQSSVKTGKRISEEDFIKMEQRLGLHMV